MMMMHELPDAPTLEVKIAKTELVRHNRLNAGYFEERLSPNVAQDVLSDDHQPLGPKGAALDDVE